MRYQIQTRFTPPFVQGSSTKALSAADASFLLDKLSLIYTPLSSNKISTAEFLYLAYNHALEKVYHSDELGVAMVHGVAWFWSCGTWESAPREQWAWKYLTVVDEDDVWQRLWAPVLLSSLSIECEPRKAQLSLPPPLWLNASDMPSGRAIATSWMFGLFCSKNNHPWYLASPDYEASGYENRKLARTCRLVCRDWERRLSLGDPMLKVAEGVVWYQTGSEWEKLSKRYWAWTFGPFKWWVERRQRDNVGNKFRCKCKSWYPKLIRPIDDTMRPKGKGRSITSFLVVTKERFCTRLAPSIGRRFLENVRDLDDRELCRTCRLVCRDWVALNPVSKPVLYDFKFSGSTLWYRTADDWHPLPNKYWAWMIVDVEWWTGRQSRTFSSQKLGRQSKGWHTKLIQDVDDSVLLSRHTVASARPLVCQQTPLSGSASSSAVFNLTAVDASSMRRGLCVSRASSDVLEHEPGTIPSSLHRQHSSDQDMPAAMNMIALWTLGLICRADPRADLEPDWKVTPSDTDRALARTCRLVCRDWARQFPLGDPQLKVAEEAIRYHFEEGWQHLPKSYWVWTRRELEWWVEPLEWWQLDPYERRTGRDKCKAWYPRLIQPVNDLVLSRDKDRSMTSLMAITTKSIRTHLEASIGLRFLENVHDIGDRALYRTCRLVCRDWARQYPCGDLERTRLKYSGGVALYRTERRWRVLPVTYWVWVFEAVGWWTNGCHDHEWSAKHMRKQCWGKGWVMKLIQPVDDCIGQDLSITPSRRHRRTTHVAPSLPPELFKYICNAADRESRSSRIVCSYWNEQCTPHTFANINIKWSPGRIKTLWRFSRDLECQFMQHVKMVEYVPDYNKDTSRFPWLHLLTQTSLSVGFAWNSAPGSDDGIMIWGPFGGGHRTIRSIHFGLPRSLPRSFSRGIRTLVLGNIRFKRFDDLANLVSELPDLEMTECLHASFTVIPVELAHRRPRRCRNNLRRVSLYRTDADPVSEERPAVLFLLTGLSLYLSVYNVSSFFSEHEIAWWIALTQLSCKSCSIDFECTYDSNSFKLKLCFGDGDHLSDVLLYSFQDTLKLGIAFDMTCRLKKSKQAGWQQCDDIFRTSRSQMPTVPINIIFGLGSRGEMLEFAEALQTRMPAVAGATTLNYAVGRYSNGHREGWCQASLDSEELRGEPERYLCDVYPIEVLGSS